MIYAGIGSRDTPEATLMTMFCIAQSLANMGFTLRSGGARGADRAFEEGCDYVGGKKEIYRPGDHLEHWWFHKAEQFHPAWHRCSDYAKKLHARNTPIILGNTALYRLADFVVCWTKDGKASGGTGQGIRIAKAYQIPIFNLYEQKAAQNLWAFIQEKETKCQN